MSFLYSKWTSLVYKYFITIRVAWFLLSLFYNCSIIKSDKWLCSQLFFWINVILCGDLFLLPTFDLMRGSRFYWAFFFNFGMWQLCFTDKKQFIFKWGSWKFCCNERLGTWHGNIQGSYRTLWQWPYLCISTFTSLFSNNRGATAFFPFACRSVRRWPEAFGISALDTFVDPWLHSICDRDFSGSAIQGDLQWLQF